MKTWLKLVGLLAGEMAALSVGATNGFFHNGYGAASSAMAGAGVAHPVDSMAVAINPAGMVVVADTHDFGVKLFSPWTKVSVNGFSEESSRHWFPAPNLSINHHIRDDLSVGLAVYGNGGIGNKFADNPYDLSVGGGSPTGLPDTRELSLQMINMLAVPSISWRWNERHSFGVALLLAYQRIEIRGLGLFQCFTPTAAAAGGCPAAPAQLSEELTNSGKDHAVGAGLRIGWLGQLTDNFRVGLSASSVIRMTRFNHYAELLPDSGRFDLPAMFSAGIAYDFMPRWTVVLDWQRVIYESSRAFSNSGPVDTGVGPGLAPGGDLLGGDKGFGFGWHDQDIYKIGFEYRPHGWIWRGGYNVGKRQFSKTQFAFAPLHNSVMSQNLTMGVSRNHRQGRSWSLVFSRGLNVDEKASSAIGEVRIEHTEYAVEIGYNWL
ncbi:MAG: outer membrane protein transport protein [Immundisolibacteraceae bacterium]|nr:outer membrane protein transport protein [Immundisolibacteraceae bacterium]